MKKKVLLTGATGMLGQDIIPAFQEGGYEIIKTCSQDLNITNENDVKEFLYSHNVDMVIHTAAYTNVNGAETEKAKCFMVNETGTENLVRFAAEKDALFIYISTDYVFDGTKETPYLPSDPPNPLNIYGKSKLKGEEAVTKYLNKYYIVRTSWLYGKNGRNFVETMLRKISEGEALKVVNDQTGCPTWTVDLARGILYLIEKNKPYGIYHICGSGAITWYGFAQKIIELSNFEITIVPISSTETKEAAKRPANSVMENNNSCPHWEQSLKEYLKQRDN
jgi:dTDP-4-dehydrorhamnose reductase